MDADVGQMLADVVCPCCHQVYKKAMLLPCGHGLCRPCMRRERRTCCRTCGARYSLPVERFAAARKTLRALRERAPDVLAAYRCDEPRKKHKKWRRIEWGEEGYESDDPFDPKGDNFPSMPGPGCVAPFDADVFDDVSMDEQCPTYEDWQGWEHMNLIEWDFRRAVSKNDVGAVKKWIAAGKDPECKDPHSGTTSVHTAAGYDAVDALRELHGAGVDLEATDTHDQTPLYWAARSGALNTSLYLLANGADPHWSSSYHTPLGKVEHDIEYAQYACDMPFGDRHAVRAAMLNDWS